MHMKQIRELMETNKKLEIALKKMNDKLELMEKDNTKSRYK